MLFCTLLYVAGTMDSVLIKGVSSFQRLFCTLLYVHVAGTVDSVLIKGGVPISEVLVREFPLYIHTYIHMASFTLESDIHVSSLLDIVESKKEQYYCYREATIIM